MILNKKLKIILLLVLILIPISTVTADYIYPYSMQISSIENEKSCLNIEGKQDWDWQAVMIKNNCSEDFYFYDNENNIIQNIILSNQSKKESFNEECVVAEKNYYEDSKGNSYIELNILDICKNELIIKESYNLNDTYRTSEIFEGKLVTTEHTNPEDIEYQINQHSLELTEFYSYSKSINIERKNILNVPEKSFVYKSCNEGPIIINKTNICENKKYLDDKTFWEIKLYSISSEENITIRGYTIYDDKIPLLDTIVFGILIIITAIIFFMPWIAAIFLLFSLTMFLLKKYSKKKPKIKIPKWLNWIAVIILILKIIISSIFLFF